MIITKMKKFLLIIFAILIFSSFASADLDTDLQTHLSLSDNINDSSSNDYLTRFWLYSGLEAGYDFIYYDNTTDIKEQYDGNNTGTLDFIPDVGLNFTGDNSSYFRIGNRTELTDLCDITGCSFCIDTKLNDDVGEGAIISRWEPTATNDFIYIMYSSGDQFIMNMSLNGSENNVTSLSTGPIADITTQDKQICYTYGGSNTSSGPMKAYVDGVLVNTSVSFQLDLSAWDRDKRLFVGIDDDNTAGKPYNGTLIDLFLYNRELSNADIIRMRDKGNFTTTAGESSMDFEDLAGDVIAIRDDDLVALDQYTVTAWVYNQSLWNTIFDKRDSLSDGIRVTTEGSGNLRCRKNGITVSATGSTYQDDVWHHVACVFNTTDLILYVDGVENNSASNSATVSVTADAKVGISTFAPSDTASYQDGSLYDIRFYNRSLSKEEIEALASIENLTITSPFNEQIFTVPWFYLNWTSRYPYSWAGYSINDGPTVPITIDPTTAEFYYSFNYNSTDGNITDDSGNGHTAWLKAGGDINTTWTATGGFEGTGAYQFDGENSGINLGNISDYLNKSAITLSAWVYNVNLNNQTQRIFWRTYGHNSGDRSGGLSVNTNNGVRFYIKNTNSDVYGTTTIGSLENNTWYHIVGTFERNNESRIYVNGVLNNSQVVADFDSQSTSTGPANIGYRPGQDQDWNGTLDEMFIFNRALSESDVQLLYERDRDTHIIDNLTNGNYNITMFVNLTDTACRENYARDNNGLAGYEFSNGNSNDVIGDYDGTDINSPYYNSFGLNLNGNNQYVNLTNNIPLGLNYTTCLRYTEAYKNSNFAPADIRTYLFGVTGNTEAGLTISINETLNSTITYLPTNTTGDWVFTPSNTAESIIGKEICFTIKEGNQSVYIDGGYNGSTSYINLIAPNVTNIGTRTDLNLDFNGTIEHMYFFNEVLTDSQVNDFTNCNSQYQSQYVNFTMDVPVTITSNLTVPQDAFNTDFDVAIGYNVLSGDVTCGIETNSSSLDCSNETVNDGSSVSSCILLGDVEENVTVTPFCNDTSQRYNGTTSYILIDNIYPTITKYDPNASHYYNVSDIPFNFTFFDNNLFGINITCLNASGYSVFSDEVLNIDTPYYNYTNITKFNGPPQTYSCNASAGDSHTAKEVNYNVTLLEKFLWIFGQDGLDVDNEIQIIYSSDNKMKLKSHGWEKRKDRISPVFEFKKDKINKDFDLIVDIYFNGEAYLINNSNYKAHIVIMPDSELKRGYWFDGENDLNANVTLEMNENHVRYTYHIKKQKIKHNNGKFKAESLGDLNIETLEFEVTTIEGQNFTINSYREWDDVSLPVNITVSNGTYTDHYYNVASQYIETGCEAVTIDVVASGYANNYTIDSLGCNLTDINLSFYQSASLVRAFTKFGNEQINEFSLETEEGIFSTTNGVITIFPDQGQTYYWNVTFPRYFNRTNYEFTTNDVVNNFVISDNINAKIRFVNSTGDPLTGADTTLIYPSGLEFTVVTNGTGWVDLAGEIYENNSIFDLRLEGIQGYITPITYNYNLTSTLIDTNTLERTNITIYLLDYETELPILENISINIVNYYQVSTTDGNITIEDLSISPGIIGIYAQGENYSTIQQSFTYTSQEAIEITLYLKKSNMTLGNLFVIVLDEYYYAVPRADTRLLKYFPTVGDFIEVEQCFTDSNGECVFSIVLSDELYIVSTSKIINDELITAQSSENGDFFKIDNTEIELYLKFTPEFNLPNDFDLIVIARNETLDGQISYLNAYFTDPNGFTNTICIEYDYKDGIGWTEAIKTCTTGTSGTVDITGGYLLNPDYTYRSQIYSEDSNGNFKKLYYSYRYNADDSFSGIFADYLPIIIITLTAIIIATSLLLSNITIFPIGMTALLILAGIIDPISFSPLSISVLIFINVMIFYLARKPNDNDAS